MGQASQNLIGKRVKEARAKAQPPITQEELSKLLGRVEVNRAGLSVATGKKGNKRLGNLSWEKLIELLEK